MFSPILRTQELRVITLADSSRRQVDRSIHARHAGWGVAGPTGRRAQQLTAIDRPIEAVLRALYEDHSGPITYHPGDRLRATEPQHLVEDSLPEIDDHGRRRQRSDYSGVPAASLSD
jgi:hypothetical protein